MSLKLDELRKRLLQQQSGGSEGGVSEAPSSAGNSKTSNISMPKAAERTSMADQPVTSAKVSQPLADAGVSALSEEVEDGTAERPVDKAAAKPSSAILSEAAAHLSSPRNDPEPAAPKVRSEPLPSAPKGAAAPHELADAVGKVFEQTKTFQARLEDLNRIFEPIDRMGDSAVRTFAPLSGFQKQMAQLARSFEPMRTFQQQLSQLAQDFEPVKALESQLSQVADSFQTHIGDLIKALEPAKRIRDRIEQLAAAFDQATELQEQFARLYEAFQLTPPSQHANGLDVQDSAVR